MNPVRRIMQAINSVGRRLGPWRSARPVAAGLTPASILRSVAGAPAAVLRPARAGRRGTILVIVLGTLALMSVIAVVYVVVGRADRRAVAAFVGSTRREEMPAMVRDYIAGIIGRDALATYRDGAGTLKREAFDYPFSDPFVRSVLPGQPGVSGVMNTPVSERPMRRFNAEGTFDSPNEDQDPSTLLAGSVGTIYEPRVPADPWLASVQPTNILLGDDLTDGSFPQYELRDWAHISNIAPDGRYVNLFNLRNNFESAPGFDEDEDEISSRLTLTNTDGSSQPHTSNQVMASGATANPNNPAHWSTAQLGAFRPAGAPMLTPSPRSPGGEPPPVSSPIPAAQSPWSYPEYAAYQWADTDGDRLFDARWQELVDASDGFDAARALFPRDDGHRWFVAARVVDLSAAVNVNTATDFLQAPSTPSATDRRAAGIGETPADVDLRRLLAGEDLWEMSGFVGYLGLRPPSVLPTNSIVNDDSAQYYGEVPGVRDFGPASTGMEQSEYIGDAAYNLLRTYLEYGVVPQPRVRLDPSDQYADFLAYQNQQLQAPTTAALLRRMPTTAQRRRDYTGVTLRLDDGRLSASGVAELTWFDSDTITNWTNIAPGFGVTFDSYTLTIIDASSQLIEGVYRIVGIGAGGDNLVLDRPFSPSTTTAPDQRCLFTIQRDAVSASAFGLETESELRTFRSANDPLLFSPLEVLIEGRFGDDTPYPVADHPARYGPLRTPRLDVVELSEPDRSDENGGGNLVAPSTLRSRNPDGLADLDTMTRSLVDLRQYITAVSASRPLASGPVLGVWDDDDEYREVRFGEDPRDPDDWLVPPLSLPLSAASEQTALGQSQTRLPTAQDLFRIYADALLPYSHVITFLGDPWRRSATEYAQMRTLFYGHDGPELALRHAAHLAVNMAEGISRVRPALAAGVQPEEVPYAYTVLANERAKTILESDGNGMGPGQPVASRSHPWSWWPDEQGDRRLDLNEPLTGTIRRTRLADDSNAADAPLSAAYTVFPVRPQPFLTEVSGFALYTDAPPAAGGDSEATDITINGAHRATNFDLAWQGIAFQVTNPFPQDVQFNPEEYYLQTVALIPDPANPGEFIPDEANARYFKISGPTGFTLGRHDTRVLYAQLRDDATTIMKWDQYAANAGMTNYAPFKDRILSGGQVPAPILLEEFNPDPGGDPTPPSVGIFEDLDGNYVTEFRLWHVQRNSNAGESGFASNDVGNDVLLDRLRDPGDPSSPANPPGPTLEALTINNGVNAEITNAPATFLGIGNDYSEGVTYLLWSTMRRPADPSIVPGMTSDVTWLPAYCIERKHADHANALGVRPLNIAADDLLKRDNIDVTDLDADLPRSEVELMFAPVVSGGTPVQLPTITLDERPVDKTLDPIPLNLSTQPWLANVSAMVNGASVDVTLDNRVELYTNILGGGTRGLRPADLLIPPAIGPSFEAVLSGGTLAPAPRPWTTLGEAMALALDYDRTDPADTVLWAPGRPPTGLDQASLDRGHLVLDDFVPFIDVNPNGQPYNPAVDIVLGDGRPLAQSIADSVRGLGDEFGNFRRPIPGLININTAPLAVLRTLPMLSPSHGSDPASAWNAGSAWWGNASGQTQDSDVASAIIAWRDRIAMFPRGGVLGAPPPAGEDVVDFSVEGVGFLNPRQYVANIPGVRELPGFRSVAELLNVRVVPRDPNPPNLPFAPRIAGLHDFDRLGSDYTLTSPRTAVSMQSAGVDPIHRTGLPSGVDRMVNEYDERLALLTAIGNTVTVRSDVYCVYFVLHGYRREDCTGLTNDRNQAEPLIPSIARRFMMIVDRSNVVAPSDQPKVLLFREVPYSATPGGDGSAI